MARFGVRVEPPVRLVRVGEGVENTSAFAQLCEVCLYQCARLLAFCESLTLSFYLHAIAKVVRSSAVHEVSADAS